MADKNNLTTLAKRLRPLLGSWVNNLAGQTVEEGPGIDIVKTGDVNTVGLGGDTILLYKSNGDPVAEFAATEAGLTAALAAAASGEIIVLPAGTITLTSSSTIYTAGAEISTGAIPVTNPSGATIPGLTIGQWYAIEAFNGPWHPYPPEHPGEVGAYTWGGFGPDGRMGRDENNGGGFYLNLPSWAVYGEAVDANYARAYFQATATSKIVVVPEVDFWPDNWGTLSWRLKSATVTGQLIIPPGVELIGMGKNSVLDGSITNNGIMTNLKITGVIGGVGAVRLVANTNNNVFSEQIKSLVSSGTPPFVIQSDTQVQNLNADLLDGHHWGDVPMEGTGGVVTNETIARITGDITIVDDAKHNGFPVMLKLDTGDLAVFYKQATSHDYDSDSVVLMRKSSDDGLTWSAATTVATSATYDIGPTAGVVLSTGRIVLVYGQNELSPDGPFTDSNICIYSDDDGDNWSSPYIITTSLTDYDHGSANHIAVLSTGILVLGLHGKNTGDTYDSAILVYSSDDGETWGNEVTIADGETDGWNYQEPNLVKLQTGELVALIRSDGHGLGFGGYIYRSISLDDGLTWDEPQQLFAGTGRPATDQLSNGLLLIVYRDNSDKHAYYRISYDKGVTWEAAARLTSYASEEMMAYASAVEYTDSLIGIAWSDEQVDTNADLYYCRFYTVLIAGQFESKVPTGTPPLVVASTTKVDNLNADLLDGYHASAFVLDSAPPEGQYRQFLYEVSGGTFTFLTDVDGNPLEGLQNLE